MPYHEDTYDRGICHHDEMYFVRYMPQCECECENHLY